MYTVGAGAASVAVHQSHSVSQSLTEALAMKVFVQGRNLIGRQNTRRRCKRWITFIDNSTKDWHPQYGKVKIVVTVNKLWLYTIIMQLFPLLHEGHISSCSDNEHWHYKHKLYAAISFNMNAVTAYADVKGRETNTGQINRKKWNIERQNNNTERDRNQIVHVVRPRSSKSFCFMHVNLYSSHLH